MQKTSRLKRSNKHGFNVLRPTGTTAIQSCIRATLDTRKSRKESVGQENVPPCRNAHCNTWSVGSQDGMDPVCSSSQIPVPDILMSWGGGTPQETMPKIADKLLQNDLQTEVEQDKSVHQSGVETRISPEAAYPKDDAEGNLISERSEVFFKQEAEEEEQQYAESRNNEEYLGLVGSVRHCLTYADELLQSSSHKLPDNEQEYSIETNLLEDTAPIIPSINNSSYLKRTWNESIWSVESLAPFIPTEEWLQRDYLLAADVIVEQAEKDNPIVKSSPTKEDKNRSSEPEANRSPNQDILNEQQQQQQQKKRTSPPQQEESLNLKSIGKTCARKLNLQNGAGIEVEDGALGNEEVGLLGKEQLGVPMADQKTAEVSPSKVDFGVQCNEFQEHRCACEERRCSMGPNRNQPFTYSENKNGNYRQGEGPIMRGQTQKNQRKQGYRKPRGQDGSQHEAYSGYYGKPGKHQGGNGRNPPY
ncbi:Glutamyl-tRNA(Gln) amidotransferase subunit A [Dissostichus eleginoides]|uniref:Glutamyl-tRNA(Gln) amidotransferase subunit A n=1 Tax=Dissostichus eleginoides TaxID=100907 RepID=A0AAD9ES46_DISEL|nr:Glutamyl-tRNA(Gln) amidotransferase subunit A [Dissostichus eleginoides]